MILPLLLVFAPSSFAQDSVVTLTLTRTPIIGPSPVTESFIVSTPLPVITSSPPINPVAVVILLPGGNGDVHLTPMGIDGTLDINSNNFLTRSRWLFAGHNLIVLTLDAASDYLITTPTVLKHHQGDLDHIGDVDAVIQYARSTYPGLPVWLVGTSRGTAGAFVAASAGPTTGPDGLVFSSALNGSTLPLDPDSLFSATVSSIIVPVLLVNDLGNTCMNTLPSGDPAVKKALTGSPVVNIINIPAGGLLPLTDNCDPLSDHGYFGRERIAVQEIANWVLAH